MASEEGKAILTQIHILGLNYDESNPRQHLRNINEVKKIVDKFSTKASPLESHKELFVSTESKDQAQLAIEFIRALMSLLHNPLFTRKSSVIEILGVFLSKVYLEGMGEIILPVIVSWLEPTGSSKPTFSNGSIDETFVVKAIISHSNNAETKSLVDLYLKFIQLVMQSRDHKIITRGYDISRDLLEQVKDIQELHPRLFKIMLGGITGTVSRRETNVAFLAASTAMIKNQEKYDEEIGQKLSEKVMDLVCADNAETKKAVLNLFTVAFLQVRDRDYWGKTFCSSLLILLGDIVPDVYNAAVDLLTKWGVQFQEDEKRAQRMPSEKEHQPNVEKAWRILSGLPEEPPDNDDTVQPTPMRAILPFTTRPLFTSRYAIRSCSQNVMTWAKKFTDNADERKRDQGLTLIRFLILASDMHSTMQLSPIVEIVSHCMKMGTRDKSLKGGEDCCCLLALLCEVGCIVPLLVDKNHNVNSNEMLASIVSFAPSWRLQERVVWGDTVKKDLPQAPDESALSLLLAIVSKVIGDVLTSLEEETEERFKDKSGLGLSEEEERGFKWSLQLTSTLVSKCAGQMSVAEQHRMFELLLHATGLEDYRAGIAIAKEMKHRTHSVNVVGLEYLAREVLGTFVAATSLSNGDARIGELFQSLWLRVTNSDAPNAAVGARVVGVSEFDRNVRMAQQVLRRSSSFMSLFINTIVDSLCSILTNASCRGGVRRAFWESLFFVSSQKTSAEIFAPHFDTLFRSLFTLTTKWRVSRDEEEIRFFCVQFFVNVLKAGTTSISSDDVSLWTITQLPARPAKQSPSNDPQQKAKDDAKQESVDWLTRLQGLFDDDMPGTRLASVEFAKIVFEGKVKGQFSNLVIDDENTCDGFFPSFDDLKRHTVERFNDTDNTVRNTSILTLAALFVILPQPMINMSTSSFETLLIHLTDNDATIRRSVLTAVEAFSKRISNDETRKPFLAIAEGYRAKVRPDDFEKVLELLANR
ncbi:hypothetical protein BLNAU_11884 [Blattamonas nauphoetae]|uniref:Uncharacterized protein n=1 Tax=Blattamonas nauphoetae TaxID=2049346 RepID=A0ABQ9XNK1_9EUKA|nr:hypothetical protein BLNAU_11884 [Blattamonas nauphoetae]